MDAPYLVDKPLGATPLEALALLRDARPELADVKLSYAGRLDPMASGLVLALHGPLLARQEDFWHLPKVYDASILLGMTTDSYDVLGMPTPVIAADSMPTHERILATAARLVGKHRLAVPAFSSHRINGLPLFSWTRAGVEVSAPVRTMAVTEVVVHDITQRSMSELWEQIHTSIPLVRGDFRQEAILTGWEDVLEGRGEDELSVLRLTVHCAAGTYIRSLANAVGRHLGTGGILLALRRTRVGQWRVDAPDVVRSAQHAMASVI